MKNFRDEYVGIRAYADFGVGKTTTTFVRTILNGNEIENVRKSEQKLLLKKHPEKPI